MNSNATPIDWALRPIHRYADFAGRAPRAEYWWFALLIVIGEIIATILDSIAGTGGVAGPYGWILLIFALAVLVPSLAVGVRRLHDTNRTGWWMLIGLVPLIGFIVLLVFFVSHGDRGENQYGPDPYGGSSAT